MVKRKYAFLLALLLCMPQSVWANDDDLSLPDYMIRGIVIGAFVAVVSWLYNEGILTSPPPQLGPKKSQEETELEQAKKLSLQELQKEQSRNAKKQEQEAILASLQDNKKPQPQQYEPLYPQVGQTPTYTPYEPSAPDERTLFPGAPGGPRS